MDGAVGMVDLVSGSGKCWQHRGPAAPGCWAHRIAPVPDVRAVPTDRPHRRTGLIIAAVAPIYITGHRNPDSDSIAAAIGYAELKRRLDPGGDYVPVRLGDCNTQTNWLLERAGAEAPAFLPHVMPRAQDVMKTEFPMARLDEPIREAGLAMAKADLELVPIVDDDGRFAGVMTERALARRYVRESRATSTLEEAPTYLSAIVDGAPGRAAGR